MEKLNLEIENKMIQGEFGLKRLNFLLVFQVNCPGCFLYGLPVLNKLAEDSRFNEVSFLALSTAFEDYDKNNTLNTTRLSETGELVGETKKELNKRGYDKLPYDMNFPIAMDKEVTSSEELEKLTETICHSNPNYRIWPKFEQDLMNDKVSLYLKSHQTIHHTFNSNNFKGTPTFVLFNDQYQIYEKWFGHKTIEEIQKLIQNHLTSD